MPVVCLDECDVLIFATVVELCVSRAKSRRSLWFATQVGSSDGYLMRVVYAIW